MPRVLQSTQVFSGTVVAILGGLVLLESRSYEIGTSQNMGPGYFPTILGVGLILLGVCVVVFDERLPPALTIRWATVRSMCAITAAILVFGYLIERFGLGPAVFVSVIISSLANDQSTFRRTVVLAVALCIFSIVIFVGLLNLPIAVVRF